MTLTDIGIRLGIYCLTPNLECCSDSETPNTTSVTREWYLPDGRLLTSDNSPFLKNRVSSAVALRRDPFTPAPSGVYRCEIPDSSGTSQNIYVGIYPQEVGEIRNTIIVIVIPIIIVQALPLSYHYCLTKIHPLLIASLLVGLLPLSLGRRMVSQ